MATGQATQVRDLPIATELAADVAAGATSISVADLSILDWAGGTLIVGDEVLAYTIPVGIEGTDEIASDDLTDPDGGTVALGAALANSWPADTPVTLSPVTYERTVWVSAPEAEEELAVRVPEALLDKLLPGVRDPDTPEVVEFDQEGDELIASNVLGGPGGPTSDGIAPTVSPDPVVFPGDTYFALRWPLIDNQDLVVYEVHVSTVAGFTPDDTTLAALTLADAAVVKTLPSGAAFVAGTTYHFKVVATDPDGAGEPSADVADSLVPLPSWALTSDGIPPALSPAPSIIAGDTFFAVRWTPITNADPVTYEVHISTSSGFTPDGTTKAGETAAGSMIVNATAAGAPLVQGTTYYFKIKARDADGAAAPSTQASSVLVKLPSSSQQTDGSPPGSSPAPTVSGGPTFLAARWTPVANNDPVTYEVHISSASGFTPSGGTKYVETSGASAIIKTDAAGAALAYGTPYYVKIIAKDGDGSAAGSTQGSASMVQIDGGADILARSIVAGDVAVDTLTANEIAAAAISTGELAANAVTAAKIAAGTITANEIAANTITAAKIAAGTITGTEIAANTITAAKMNVSQLSAIAADLGTVTAGTLTAATMRTAALSPKVQMDFSGLFMTDSGGSTLVKLDTSGLWMLANTLFSQGQYLSWRDSGGVEHANVATSQGIGAPFPWVLGLFGENMVTAGATGHSVRVIDDANKSSFMKVAGSPADRIVNWGSVLWSFSAANAVVLNNIAHGLGKTPGAVIAISAPFGFVQPAIVCHVDSFTSTDFRLLLSTGTGANITGTGAAWWVAVA